MSETARAHAWTAGILFGTLLALWFVIANPRVILWAVGLAVLAVAYVGLYLVVRAHQEGYDEGDPEEES
jgi:hypothetical protein